MDLLPPSSTPAPAVDEFEDLAPPSSSQGPVFTADTASASMRAKAEAQKRRELLKVAIAGLKVHEASCFIGSLNPRGPTHLQGFAAAEADTNVRISNLVELFIGPEGDLSRWEPMTDSNRLEVVIRAPGAPMDSPLHLKAEQRFIAWFKSKENSGEPLSAADIVDVDEELDINFEVLAGQGRLLAIRQLFAKKEFASFAPWVYVTLYKNEILEDPIVFNAVTRSSNRNNGVTPFSPIEIFTQIFEGGKMNESVAAALQESIAEAGGSSALQKMRAGLANPTILTAVQELLQSAVLAQRGFNLLPANFTLWRHQGGTTTALCCMKFYKDLLVRLEFMMVTSGTMEKTAQPDFLNKVFKFFGAFTFPLVKTEAGEYKLDGGEKDWETAVHRALAPPARAAETSSRRSKKRKARVEPIEGLAPLPTDENTIWTSFGLPRVYNDIKALNLVWFANAAHDGSIYLKIPPPQALHALFLSRHWQPVQVYYFRPIVTAIATKLGITVSFDMRSKAAKGSLDDQNRTYLSPVVATVPGFTETIAAAVDAALFPLDPLVHRELVAHRLTSNGTPAKVSDPALVWHSKTWPSGYEGVPEKLPFRFRDSTAGSVFDYTNNVLNAFGGLVDDEMRASLFEPAPTSAPDTGATGGKGATGEKGATPEQGTTGAAAASAATGGGASATGEAGAAGAAAGEASANGAGTAGPSAAASDGAGGTPAAVERPKRGVPQVNYAEKPAAKAPASPRKPSEPTSPAEGAETSGGEGDGERPNKRAKHSKKSPPPATLSEEHKAALDAAAAAAVPTGPASTPLRAIQQQTGLDLGLATPKTTLFGTHPPATFGPHHVPEPYRDLYRGASNLVQEGLKSMFGSNVSQDEMAMLATMMTLHRRRKEVVIVPSPSDTLGKHAEFLAMETPLGMFVKELVLAVFPEDELAESSSGLDVGLSAPSKEAEAAWRSVDYIYPLVSRTIAAILGSFTLAGKKTPQQVKEAFSQVEPTMVKQWSAILGRVKAEIKHAHPDAAFTWTTYSQDDTARHPHMPDFAMHTGLATGAWRDDDPWEVKTGRKEFYMENEPRWRGQRRNSQAPTQPPKRTRKKGTHDMELGDTSDEEAELPTPGALGKGSGVKSGEKEKKPKIEEDDGMSWQELAAAQLGKE